MSAINRGAVRIERDFYPTPKYTIDLILERIQISRVKVSLEPCKGSNCIYDLMPGETKLWCEIAEGIDYLNTSFNDTIDLVLTNPPFSQAIEFLTKSLTESNATVIYLLRINFLGGELRREFWIKNPPSHLYVLSKRPSFDGEGTDATEYAWFVWDRKGIMTDPPGIYVIGYAPFKGLSMEDI